ncbi:hypothetical protein [Rhodococcoides fascians]|uniref:hypothetical protein n=1 Tax=Rhodococcoides fascians TaxID=1828 RepID=UPI00050C2CB5|nr:hypothetical protein [Rhodococcus fascians]
MTVFQESVIVQVLILLTLWGFAIDTLVRRRRQRKPTPPNPNAARATTVLIWICAGFVLFVVVIMFLAAITS